METALDDATIRFDFRASALATSGRIGRGPDGGVTPGTVHETYGAGQPGKLSRRKIRLSGPASRGRQGRPLSGSARDSVGWGRTGGVRQPPPPIMTES